MAADGRTFPVGTVFAHVFRYFRDKAIEECKLFSKTDLTQDDVKWFNYHSARYVERRRQANDERSRI